MPVASLPSLSPIVLHLGPVRGKLDDHDFFEFCQLNPEWRIERTSAGDLVIMAPTGGLTGSQNFTLTEAEREEFPPLCPDFVVELRSRSDSLTSLQAKLEEYVENGAELGWLIDPQERTVYIYRPRTAVQRVDNPQEISGDPVLPGFTLEVARLWQTP